MGFFNLGDKSSGGAGGVIECPNLGEVIYGWPVTCGTSQERSSAATWAHLKRCVGSMSSAIKTKKASLKTVSSWWSFFTVCWHTQTKPTKASEQWVALFINYANAGKNSWVIFYVLAFTHNLSTSVSIFDQSIFLPIL